MSPSSTSILDVFSPVFAASKGKRTTSRKWHLPQQGRQGVAATDQQLLSARDIIGPGPRRGHPTQAGTALAAQEGRGRLRHHKVGTSSSNSLEKVDLSVPPPGPLSRPSCPGAANCWIAAARACTCTPLAPPYRWQQTWPSGCRSTTGERPRSSWTPSPTRSRSPTTSNRSGAEQAETLPPGTTRPCTSG